MRYENDPRICAHCRWLGSRDVEVSSGEVVQVNRCHRNAPLVTGGLHTPIETVWPKVALNDWCGDFAEEEPEKLRPDPIMPDPRDPDYSRPGIFATHNCWRCKDGKLPCVASVPGNCGYPHARND